MFTKANRSGRLALSRAMMKTIGAFARTGDPNNDALGTVWKPWPSRIVFNADNDAARISAK
jgi:para-nitrobenzyl esterase